MTAEDPPLAERPRTGLHRCGAGVSGADGGYDVSHATRVVVQPQVTDIEVASWAPAAKQELQEAVDDNEACDSKRRCGVHVDTYIDHEYPCGSVGLEADDDFEDRVRDVGSQGSTVRLSDIRGVGWYNSH